VHDHCRPTNGPTTAPSDGKEAPAEPPQPGEDSINAMLAQPTTSIAIPDVSTVSASVSTATATAMEEEARTSTGTAQAASPRPASASASYATGGTTAVSPMLLMRSTWQVGHRSTIRKTRLRAAVTVGGGWDICVFRTERGIKSVTLRYYIPTYSASEKLFGDLAILQQSFLSLPLTYWVIQPSVEPKKSLRELCTSEW
jgi:hypothetical protein